MALRFTKYCVILELDDGRDVHVPLEWSTRLRDASRKQLEHYRLGNDGATIHWPDLDEDWRVVDLLYPPRFAATAVAWMDEGRR